jgi:hypothetical protein
MPSQASQCFSEYRSARRSPFAPAVNIQPYFAIVIIGIFGKTRHWQNLQFAVIANDASHSGSEGELHGPVPRKSRQECTYFIKNRPKSSARRASNRVKATRGGRNEAI